MIACKIFGKSGEICFKLTPRRCALAYVEWIERRRLCRYLKACDWFFAENIQRRLRWWWVERINARNDSRMTADDNDNQRCRRMMHADMHAAVCPVAEGLVYCRRWSSLTPLSRRPQPARKHAMHARYARFLELLTCDDVDLWSLTFKPKICAQVNPALGNICTHRGFPVLCCVRVSSPHGTDGRAMRPMRPMRWSLNDRRSMRAWLDDCFRELSS